MRAVPIFPRGEVHHRAHPDGVFEVDDAFVADLVSSYEAISSDGYLAPIMSEHTPDGSVRGIILSVYSVEGGEYAAYADISWRADIYERIQAGEFAYLSPSFRMEGQHPHTGAMLPILLREISLVSAPHLKGLPRLTDHYSLKDVPTLGHTYALSEEGYITRSPTEISMSTTETPEQTGNDTTTEAAPGVASILQAIEGLALRVDNLQANVTAPAAPVDNSEDPCLRDEISELREKLALSEACATYAAKMPGATPARITAVAMLSLSDAAQADEIVAMHAQSGAPATQAPIQPPIGSAGTPSAGPITMSEAFDKVEAELGTTNASRVIPKVCERYPHLKAELGL